MQQLLDGGVQDSINEDTFGKDTEQLRLFEIMRIQPVEVTILTAHKPLSTMAGPTKASTSIHADGFHATSALRGADGSTATIK
ncbi:hypothetical protein Ae201684_007662 [Aphanomyces euteiches]|uniref:Uncharacterized protein n=1 Tax=Aphanomyces euteiches TaxID=100861 RepID=A0A6G0X7X7_9STRA|nr:hypothetical protein Ae201684_007662 [Aphanomyces euteiches]